MDIGAFKQQLTPIDICSSLVNLRVQGSQHKKYYDDFAAFLAKLPEAERPGTAMTVALVTAPLPADKRVLYSRTPGGGQWQNVDEFWQRFLQDDSLDSGKPSGSNSYKRAAQQGDDPFCPRCKRHGHSWDNCFHNPDSPNYKGPNYGKQFQRGNGHAQRR